ncbi:MAG: c-type cytochrome [Gammaproteobacteria bacterium]
MSRIHFKAAGSEPARSLAFLRSPAAAACLRVGVGMALAMSVSLSVQAKPYEEESDEDTLGMIWTPERLKLAASGDPERGKKLALDRKHKCFKCHGETGISDEEDVETPNLAGQLPHYIFKQLMDYKSKARVERSMNKQARRLEPQDMADLAAYYAGQTPERPEPSAASVPLLVMQGDYERRIMPCALCHGFEGEGLGFQLPVLAGQKKEYLVFTLNEFREGDRANDRYGHMADFVERMTPEEIELVAAYFAKLAPKGPVSRDAILDWRHLMPTLRTGESRVPKAAQ